MQKVTTGNNASSTISSDLFDIASRLKNIDTRYNVFYNNYKNRYEVHSNFLEFIIPFDCLDERTIEHAWRTRRENQIELEQEIDSHNQMLEQSAINQMNESMNQLQDMMDFAYRTSRDVTFAKTQKWV